jgi:hypothetical protein
MFTRTTKVPALGAVQSAERSFVESLTTILPPFSTELSTVVLKTFFCGTSVRKSLKKKSRLQGRLQENLLARS